MKNYHRAIIFFLLLLCNNLGLNHNNFVSLNAPILIEAVTFLRELYNLFFSSNHIDWLLNPQNVFICMCATVYIKLFSPLNFQFLLNQFMVLHAFKLDDLTYKTITYYTHNTILIFLEIFFLSWSSWHIVFISQVSLFINFLFITVVCQNPIFLEP